MHSLHYELLKDSDLIFFPEISLRTPCAHSMDSLQNFPRVLRNSGVPSLAQSPLLSLSLFWCAHLEFSSLNSKQISSALLALASQSISITLVCTPCTSLRAYNTQNTTDREFLSHSCKRKHACTNNIHKHTKNIRNKHS
jgi:hypothetical protein